MLAAFPQLPPPGLLASMLAAPAHAGDAKESEADQSESKSVLQPFHSCWQSLPYAFTSPFTHVSPARSQM